MTDLLQYLEPWWQHFSAMLSMLQPDRAWWLGALSSFALIAAAEVGDKSQLVCMTLAARHRPWPVLMGAILAFSLLNLLAVVFGAAVAAWLPTWLVGLAIALLFGIFGIHALGYGDGDEDETIPLEKSGHGIFFTTLAMILVAEFGDKTQIAVAGLSTTVAPSAVWLGASLALTMTSALGVVAGRTLLQRLPVYWLHRFSGLIFLGLAVLALVRTVPWQRVIHFMDRFHWP